MDDRALEVFRATGQPIWGQRLNTPATSPTSADEERVAVGIRDGRVMAYSLVPSEQERFRPLHGPPGGFDFAWQTNGPVTGKRDERRG